MRSPRPTPLLWAHDGRVLVGTGEIQRFDPGTGPDRYEKALVALRESGYGTAYASFTFDPDFDGSVILVPEHVEERDIAKLGDITPMPGGRVLSKGLDAWKTGLRKALDSLDAGSVEKVVLSRQVEMEFESEISAGSLLRRLHDDQPACYSFSVDGLIGASPELLVSFSGGIISSLVLAGTASSAAELGSSKNDREHRYAASSVETALSPHVESLTCPGTTVIGFGEIKHLASRFEGAAVPGTSVLDILASLHPTASVAGTPQDPAMRLIREIEPTTRGRYAGPVGWFDADGEGEFAIALRCGLAHGTRMTLYAGGGIVRGSEAEAELEETELKLRPMLKALELG